MAMQARTSRPVNRNRQLYNARRRDNRPLPVRYWYVCLFLAVILGGSIMQLHAISVLRAEQKEIAAVTANIHELQSQKESLQIRVNTMKQNNELEKRAASLGMVRPDGDSIRRVNVQAVYNETETNTNAQTAMNGENQ